MTISYRITKIESELTVTVQTARLFCLPSSLTTLEDEAFSGIDSQYILLPETLTDFGENVFGSGASEITFYVHKGSTGESYCQAHGYNYRYVSQK